MEEVSEIQKLIVLFKSLIQAEVPMMNIIKQQERFFSSLNELDNLVEMKEAKQSIIEQIKYIIVICGANPPDDKNIFEGHVLHTLISGPPGVGKTRLGTILANIWVSLGLIKKPDPPKKKKNKKPCMKKILMMAEIDFLRESLKVKDRQMASINTIAHHQRNRVKSVLEDITKVKTKLQKAVKKNLRLAKKLKKLRTEKKLALLEKDNFTMNNFHEEQENFYNKEEKLPIIRLMRDDNNNLFVRQDATVQEAPVEQPTLIDTAIKETRAVRFALDEILEITDKAAARQEEEEDEEEESPITTVSRDAFVAEYVGQTAIKTKKLLTKNLGKVLFIDEAYSLINGERDTFGMEALTVLNQFMSEHPNEIVVIFAGYKELMQKTIFAVQPGLQRRISWTFNVSPYTPVGLSQIFTQQILQHGWTLDVKNILKFFNENEDKFPNYGGDTNKLAYHCKLEYADVMFEKTCLSLTNKDEIVLDKTITTEILQRAIKKLSANNVSKKAHLFDYRQLYV